MAALLLLAGAGLSACGGGRESGESRLEPTEQAAEHDLETAADRTVCRADADPVDKPYGEGFPDAWSFPPRPRSTTWRTAATPASSSPAVSSAPFQDILDYLNHDAVDAGFAVTEGETEEHDAEANWKSDAAGRPLGDPRVGRLPGRDRDPGLRRGPVVTTRAAAGPGIVVGDEGLHRHGARRRPGRRRANREAVLTTIRRNGLPQLSNVLHGRR